MSASSTGTSTLPSSSASEAYAKDEAGTALQEAAQEAPSVLMVTKSDGTEVELGDFKYEAVGCLQDGFKPKNEE